MGLNIDQQIKGGLLKNYHLEDLRLARLPLCDDREQEELVRQIEENLSNLEELETTLEQQLVRADTLRQSILQKAFPGNSYRKTRMTSPRQSSLSASNLKKLHGLKTTREQNADA